jgi:hypothetical protein
VHEFRIVQIENGSIAEMWAGPDLPGMLSRLGLLVDQSVATKV